MEKVEVSLLKLGIPLSLKGYEELEKAVELKIQNPDISLGEITTNIMERNKESFSAVSRRLYRMVETCYPMMDEEKKLLVFGASERVTTNEFIRTVAYSFRKGFI